MLWLWFEPPRSKNSLKWKGNYRRFVVWRREGSVEDLHCTFHMLKTQGMEWVWSILRYATSFTIDQRQKITIRWMVCAENTLPFVTGRRVWILARKNTIFDTSCSKSSGVKTLCDSRVQSTPSLLYYLTILREFSYSHSHTRAASCVLSLCKHSGRQSKLSPETKLSYKRSFGLRKRMSVLGDDISCTMTHIEEPFAFTLRHLGVLSSCSHVFSLALSFRKAKWLQLRRATRRWSGESVERARIARWEGAGNEESTRSNRFL